MFKRAILILVVLSYVCSIYPRTDRIEIPLNGGSDIILKSTANAWHVATDGNDDGGDGSAVNPWKTITYALTQMSGGDMLMVHKGKYVGRYSITRSLSGLSENKMTIIKSAGDGEVILDGDGTGTVISMSNVSNILLEGFTVTNATSNGIHYSTDRDPATLAMAAAAYNRDLPPSEANVSPFNNIIIKNNKVYNINTTRHGIAVYAGNYMAPVTNLVIDGNEAWGNRTHASETIVVNGNINGFDICHNLVYNNNNIGIDMIGFEGTARIPVVNDQQTNLNLFPDPVGTLLGNLGRDRFNMAKNGKCYDNVIYASCVINNEAYWEPDGGRLGTRIGPKEGEFDRCCNGIYIDGGMNIEVFNNFVFDSDIGIEVSTEHGPPDLYWVEKMYVHDNIIASNTGWNGLSIGGQSVSKDFHLGGVMGKTRDSRFENNILYGNVVNMNVQNTENNTFKNNIIMGGGAAVMDWLAPILYDSNDFETNFWYNDPAFGVTSSDYYRELNRIEQSQLAKQEKMTLAPLLNPKSGNFSVRYGAIDNAMVGTDVNNWKGRDWEGKEWKFNTSYFDVYADFLKAYDEMAKSVKYLEENRFDLDKATGYGNMRAYLNDMLQKAGFSNSSVPYVLKVWAPRSERVDGYISVSPRTDSTFATDPYGVVNMMNPDAGNNFIPENTRAINNGNINSAALTKRKRESANGHVEYKYLVMVITKFNNGKSYTQGETHGGVILTTNVNH